MKNLQQKAKEIRLTPQEKTAMRLSIFGAPSPISIQKSPYVLLSHKWMTALAALLIVIFTGGTTAFAAEGALPGQSLYALKTAVIEPIRVALAPTAGAKAEVHAQLAATRIEEAETLAQNGSLDATTSAQLADAFDEHSNAALAFAGAAGDADPSALAQVKAQIDASSAAGGSVLTALARRGGNEKNSEHSKGLAVRLLARAGESSAAKAQTFAATAPAPMAAHTMGVTADSASSDNERGGGAAQAAIELQLKAQGALAAAQALASTTATTSVSAEGMIKDAANLIADGSQALKDARYETAVDDFSRALSLSLRAQAVLKAEAQFNIKTDDENEGHSSGSSGEGGVELHL